MKQSLPDALRAHYQEASLDQDQLAQLRQLLPKPEPEPRRRLLFYRLMLPAAVLVVLAMGFLGLRSYQRHTMIQQILQESIYNHKKNLAMDVNTASMEEIRLQLTQLSFRIADLEKLAQPALQLEGGRYCSLLGEPAALLRMTDPGNQAENYTLYQVPLPPRLAHLAKNPIWRQKSGFQVSMWGENGILVVLTGPDKAGIDSEPQP